MDFTIAAGGEITVYPSIDANATTDGKTSFLPMFDKIRPWIEGADLALCHLEAPITPDGNLSGYPIFSVSPQIAQDIADSGWDGCSTASNHALDRGLPGVASTLDALAGAGLGSAGTNKSSATAGAPQLYQVSSGGRTITVAQLAATYGTNGIPIPSSAPWSVQLIDSDQIIDQARAAREAGADIVIVSLHDGQEYKTSPTSHQRSVTRKLAESGLVDLVIGNHAHVPQPIEKLQGGPSGNGMWVAYGLGNLLSSQSSATNPAQTEAGELVFASVHADAGGPARITSMAWVPTTVDIDGGDVIYPMTSVESLGTLPKSLVETRRNRVVNVVGEGIPLLTDPLSPSGVTVTVIPR